jgi:hypothetical protein
MLKMMVMGMMDHDHERKMMSLMWRRRKRRKIRDDVKEENRS